MNPLRSGTSVRSKPQRTLPRRSVDRRVTICQSPCSPLCQIPSGRPVAAKRTIEPFSRLKSTVYDGPDRVITGWSAAVQVAASMSTAAAKGIAIAVSSRMVVCFLDKLLTFKGRVHAKALRREGFIPVGLSSFAKEKHRKKATTSRAHSKVAAKGRVRLQPDRRGGFLDDPGAAVNGGLFVSTQDWFQRGNDPGGADDSGQRQADRTQVAKVGRRRHG